MSRPPQNPRLALVSVDDAPAGLAEALRVCAEAAGWSVCAGTADDPEDLVDDAVALALAPPGADAGSLRRHYPHALIVTGGELGKADLVVPADAGEGLLRPLLAHAREQWQRNRKILTLHRELGARRERMRQLSDIALSLSTRMEFPELLETILCEARKLAGCEAGSLYLVDDESSDEPELVFKLAQNDAVDVPFVEGRLPLTPTSLAGYVALSGETLDIPDAYQIPPGRPYRFNRSFDDDMGYRTRSLLVIPMRDHRDKIVGVLQFINRLDPTEDQPVPFGEEIGELLRAVASQAAVSIQKNTLIRDVHRLFESFVQASVKTIEQRDPSTSGHSFRVAQTTVALLEALPASGQSRFAALAFTPEHMREVRYAALLHDFGKIGVRENILLKANKLSDDRLEVIHYRVELQKERLRRRAVERVLEMLHHPREGIDVARRRLHRELEAELSLLDQYFDFISLANRPTPLDDGDFAHLRELRDYAFLELDGTRNGLITDDDLTALSIRRGSLTPEERREIESHVTHTRDFLAVLPWPPELARVPEIAGAHHEKLDGSGYPNGLVGEQIPLASRVMTVCDIFDALTAMDRPYKSSMSVDTALDVLGDEARRGLVDGDILQVFIDSGICRETRVAHSRLRQAG
ncbi:MAG: HD domain-containing phosphohydrolase [Gammaproteobacteria bacterium]|nr:HD domain-containing phosphohydrolase [Gammaproteobacteria bacterium]